MAIGNYWECVVPEGESAPLERVVGESTTLARQHFSSWRFEPDGEDLGGADFMCMGFATGDIRAIVHLVKPRGQPNFYLHSAFPWLAAGAPTRLKVCNSDTDHFGLEGLIGAGIDDGPYVKFFDPLYALNKGKYEIGSALGFMLAGLSLDLKPACLMPGRVTINQEEVDTSRAKIFRRAAQDASDYYVFQGPVRTIRSTEFLNRPFLIFRTAVVDLDGDGLTVDIYVDRARFQSRTVPTAGDIVSGTLWLQGCLMASIVDQ